ncbi:MAG: response regulator [Desulfobacterales bacterium]
MADEAGRQIRVLIADDDEIIADILKELIDDDSRTVEICHNGFDAIEKIQKDPFDLIIVDLIMPRIGGLEVLKYAKKVDPETIVIIITGYASLETALEAIKEGAYDYIRKPCKMGEMKVVVDRATDKIRQSRENKDLLQQLQDMYKEMSVSKQVSIVPAEEKESLLFSSKQARLKHLFGTSSSSNTTIDKLKALSELRENGMLSEDEYRDFKQLLLKM